MENWKKIKGYDQYEISDFGNVKSIGNNATRKEKILKSGTIKNGYSIVVLTDWCKRKKTMYVHRLVAEHFKENKDKKREVNHINGFKSDNRSINLEWITTVDNSLHAFKTGLQPKRQDRTQSKLTDLQVIEIKRSGLRNIELSRLFNISKSVISGIQSGKLWRHISE